VSAAASARYLFFFALESHAAKPVAKRNHARCAPHVLRLRTALELRASSSLRFRGLLYGSTGCARSTARLPVVTVFSAKSARLLEVRGELRVRNAHLKKCISPLLFTAIKLEKTIQQT
jgi:hypothetical protein